MVILIWTLCGIFAALMAAKKNRSMFNWFFIGLLLGPFALLFALLANPLPAAPPDPLLQTVVSYFHKPVPPPREIVYCPGCSSLLFHNVQIDGRNLLNWCQRCKKEVF